MQAGPEQFQTPATDTAFHKIFHISSMPHTEKNIPDTKNYSNCSESIVKVLNSYKWHRSFCRKKRNMHHVTVEKCLEKKHRYGILKTVRHDRKIFVLKVLAGMLKGLNEEKI